VGGQLLVRGQSLPQVANVPSAVSSAAFGSLYSHRLQPRRGPSVKSGLVDSITLIQDFNSVLNSDPTRPLERTRSSDRSSITASKISVIVVAAERLFCLGLAGLLSEDECLDVVAVSDGEPELLGLCTATSADVVLVDLELSRVDAIDLVRSLTLECPNTRTLVLTSNPDWRVRPAMVAGAAGLLLKDTSPEAIRAAVVSVHLGDLVLCNEAARWVLGEGPSTLLTQRESAVLRMVGQGASNAEIAVQLKLGQKTVRNYVSRLYRKLELNNRAQMATYLARTDIAPNIARADSERPGNELSENSQ
jgi:DNA-binding NarL/FixJ family response regulator